MLHSINIRADRNCRGIDRSEGAELRRLRPCGYAGLKIATFSEGKTTEHEKHGCIKESCDTSDDAVRGSTLDSGDGCRADTQVERRPRGVAKSVAPNDRPGHLPR